MGDLTKLPRWAQNEIARLTNNLSAAEEAMAAAIGETPTAVEIDTYRRYDEKKKRLYVPDRTTIRFTVTGGEIDVRIDDGQLHIMGSWHHNHSFAVMPRASNVVHVGFVSPAKATP